MSELLLSIQYAGNQHENVTSNVLAEILNGIPACKEAFLDLFDPNIPKSSNPIEREVEVSSDDEKGRADFRYRSNDCVVVIENKPWEPESSVNGQLSSYAKAMRSRPEQWPEQRKYLCLLSVEANRDRLLNEIAKAEDVSVSALADAFRKNYNIVFEVRTWEQVFSTLESVQPENKALQLWIGVLRSRVIPMRRALTKEDITEKKRMETQEIWSEIRKCVEEIKNIFLTKCSIWGFGKPIQLVPIKTPLSYGFYLYDERNSNIPYWIGANLQTWELFRPVHYLFIIRAFTEEGKRKRIIDSEILTNCGFRPDEAHWQKSTYVYPLIESSESDISPENICPKEMAKKAIKTMNAVRDAIAFGVK